MMYFYKFLFLPFAQLLYFLNLMPQKAKDLMQDQKSHFVHLNKLEPIHNPIWIHAASGEIEYAKSVIREIIKKHPNQDIILTYTSPSAKNIIKKLEGVSAWMPIPFESDKELDKFITHWRPCCVLFARTDVWPNLTFHLKKNKIPSYLFSATFADNSSRTNKLSRISFENLTHIFCVSEDDKNNFLKLKISTPLTVIGDTRFDQVFFRMQNKNKLKSFIYQKNFSRILFASTWTEDEVEFLPLLPLITKDFQVIIAPHEITKNHIDLLTRELTQMSLNYKLYTTAYEWDSLNEILILDQFGILADLYAQSDIAFVGGSFKKQVHSVMEPLAAGLEVIVGPYYKNNREAIEFLKLNYVHVAQSGKEIPNLISNIKLNKNKIQDEVFKKTGATKKIIPYIERLLDKGPLPNLSPKL